jgi:2-amino-4-hydroxy-6-hydroxymethyldihydropteridine diphosphokinase
MPQLALLRAAKAIEAEMGRLPAERWGPRLIDVDLLFSGDAEIHTEELTLPHREMWNRRFVLQPLLDVLPTGQVRDQVVRRLQALPATPVVRRFDRSV